MLRLLSYPLVSLRHQIQIQIDMARYDKVLAADRVALSVVQSGEDPGQES